VLDFLQGAGKVACLEQFRRVCLRESKCADFS
jgi:hypothetical protein